MRRRMETLSDAASHLSQALKARYPDLNWRKVSDFRNFLAHGYTGAVDLGLVWQAILEDLPELQALVQEEMRRQ